MARTGKYYSSDLVELSRSYILELWRALRRYEDAMVLVGGWAPYFILQNFGDDPYNNDHIGSIDIDIALDPSLISETEYSSIESILEDIGYSGKVNANGDTIPFIFEKESKEMGFIIEVDILTSNYVSKGHRHGRIGGLLARKCHGADIAFKHFFEMRLEGELPGGGKTIETVKVVDVVGSITMKGIALGERYKEKDAYDIYYLVKFYHGGPWQVAREVGRSCSDTLIEESINTIRKEFRDRDSAACVWVSDFLDEIDDQKERRMTDVHMNITEFLDSLDRINIM